MLSSRIITQSDELTLFSSLSYRLSFGTSAELDYLNSVSVRIFFHDKDPTNFVAGYAINGKGPYRYLSVLDQAGILERTLTESQLQINDIAEIGCLWMNKQFIYGFERIQVYVQAVYDLLQTDKGTFIAGSFIKKFQPLLELFFPDVLFEGKLIIRKQEMLAKIYYIHRGKVLMRFLKTVVQLIFK